MSKKIWGFYLKRSAETNGFIVYESREDGGEISVTCVVSSNTAKEAREWGSTNYSGEDVMFVGELGRFIRRIGGPAPKDFFDDPEDYLDPKDRLGLWFERNMTR